MTVTIISTNTPSPSPARDRHSNLVLLRKVDKGDFRVVENAIVLDGTRALGGEAFEELFDVVFRRRKLDVVQIRVEVSTGSGELESTGGEEGHLEEGGSKSGIEGKVLWIHNGVRDRFARGSQTEYIRASSNERKVSGTRDVPSCCGELWESPISCRTVEGINSAR